MWSDQSTIEEFKSHKIKVFEGIYYNTKILVCLRYNLFNVVRPFYTTTNKHLRSISTLDDFISILSFHFSDHCVFNQGLLGPKYITEYFLKFKSICLFELLFNIIRAQKIGPETFSS